MYVYTYWYMYIHMYVYIYIHMVAYIYTHMVAYVFIRIYIYIWLHMYLYVYIYIYIHMYIYIYWTLLSNRWKMHYSFDDEFHSLALCLAYCSWRSETRKTRPSLVNQWSGFDDAEWSANLRMRWKRTYRTICWKVMYCKSHDTLNPVKKHPQHFLFPGLIRFHLDGI